MDRYLRKENEESIEYLLRLVAIKLEEYPKDLEWSDIVTYCGLNCHYDSLRKAMQPESYGAYAIYKHLKEKLVGEVKDNEVLKQLQDAQREIYKERQKFRDEKNEYNAWLREQSRMELFYERVDEAVDRLLQRKQRIIPKPVTINEDGVPVVIAFADAHYGVDFCIKGFRDEILNEYNPEIFESRMWTLRDEILEFCKMHNTNNVSIIDLGDSIEGLLHVSQIQSLRGNIVDDIMDYVDFIEEWLTDLTSNENGLFVNLYTSEGNHSNLRLLTGKKGDFPNENLERIYSRGIKRAFRNNPNVKIHTSLGGLNYFNVNGFNILTAHGDKENNLKNSIKDYEDTYKINVDYFIVGHLHSKNEFEVAKGKEVIQVRSLMGINTYSKDIKKTSDAGATMFTVHKDYGRKYVNEIKLK